MKIQDQKVVELIYQLEVDGSIADKVSEDKPLDYIHGMGMLIPKLEEHLTGKEPGSSFEITIFPEDSYGEYDEKNVFDIPKTSFEINGKINEELLKEGQYIPLVNSSGNTVMGCIKKINEDSVTMDFNHPMAGKTLNFSGKIISVRDATEKELIEGLHGEFVQCGCGCDEHGCGCHEHNHENNGDGCHEHGCGCLGHEEDECCGGEHHRHGGCCGKHHEK